MINKVNSRPIAFWGSSLKANLLGWQAPMISLIFGLIALILKLLHQAQVFMPMSKGTADMFGFVGFGLCAIGIIGLGIFKDEYEL